MNINENTRKVAKALRDGWNWAEIARALGTTEAQAKAQYGNALDYAAPVSSWKAAGCGEN